MRKINGDVISIDMGTDSIRACPIHTNCWPSKLKGMQGADQEFIKSNYFCTIKDLFFNKICSEFVTGQANATAIHMSDVRTRDRGNQILEIAGIFRTQSLKVQPTKTNFHPTK